MSLLPDSILFALRNACLVCCVALLLATILNAVLWYPIVCALWLHVVAQAQRLLTARLPRRSGLAPVES